LLVYLVTVTNFPRNVPVKKISKSVNIWRRYGQKFAAYVLGPRCSYKIIADSVDDADGVNLVC